MANEKNAKTASVLNIIAGIWLIISPFALGFSMMTGQTWSNVIAGLVVLILAWIRAANEGRNSELSWINLLVGIWVFISPFVQGYASMNQLLWNDLILGVIVVILSATNLAQTKRLTPQT